MHILRPFFRGHRAIFALLAIILAVITVTIAIVHAAYSVQRPITDGKIYQWYLYGEDGHKGVDFPAIEGTDVCAVADGVVMDFKESVNNGTGIYFGNFVLIRHTARHYVRHNNGQMVGQMGYVYTVNYYPEHGSQYPNRNPETVYNVQPNATAIVVQSGGQWGSARWVGSARVIASASQPIAAIVNQAATGKASSYNSFAPASRLVVLPVVRNDYGGWSSGVQVQNLDSDTANVVVRVDGNQTWSGSIGAYRSVTLYPVPGTASGFQGPVTVECTNGRRIAAMVNTVASGTGDLTMTYNGVNR